MNVNKQISKQEFLNKLKDLLSYTRLGSDIAALTLIRKYDSDYVKVTFTNGYTRDICIDCDSYAAIVKDVVARLGI